MNCPIFADALSWLRYYKKHKNIFSFYEHYIHKMKEDPDYIIRFGKKPTSKTLNLYLNNYKDSTVLISDHAGYNDDIKSICIEDIDEISAQNSPNQDWFDNLYQLEHHTKDKLSPFFTEKYFFEGNIIYHCLKHLKSNDNLFIGNSLPIRDLDKYCSNMDKKINIYANRGASGIDGLISTALGISYVNHSSRNLLILGDVSFFYDVNALQLIKNYNFNLSIVIINNNGGQIFSTLPYAKENIKGFQEFWTTPVNLSIKDVSALYKINYYNFESIDAINKQMSNTLNKPGINLIEIVCDYNKTLEIESKINKSLV